MPISTVLHNMTTEQQKGFEKLFNKAPRAGYPADLMDQKTNTLRPGWVRKKVCLRWLVSKISISSSPTVLATLALFEKYNY